VIENENLIWVDVINPTGDDIKYLKKKFGLHSLTLKTLVQTMHHPDFDIFKNYIFLILHHPYSQDNGEILIQGCDFIVGKNYLITNHYKEIVPLSFVFDDFSASGKNKNGYTERGSGYLLFLILSNFLKSGFEEIDKIENEIELLEKEMFLEKEKQLVRKISFLKAKIIDFWRVIDPQREVFFSLKNVGPKFFGQECAHYFSVLFRMYRKTENILRNSKEIINSLEETNHILVNLKMNEVIKILTVFSVVMLPLTLLASIWGMNTNFLPFADKALDFWLIMGLMFITLFIMLGYFRFKKWL